MPERMPNCKGGNSKLSETGEIEASLSNRRARPSKVTTQQSKDLVSIRL